MPSTKCEFPGPVIRAECAESAHSREQYPVRPVFGRKTTPHDVHTWSGSFRVTAPCVARHSSVQYLRPFHGCGILAPHPWHVAFVSVAAMPARVHVGEQYAFPPRLRFFASSYRGISNEAPQWAQSTDAVKNRRRHSSEQNRVSARSSLRGLGSPHVTHGLLAANCALSVARKHALEQNERVNPFLAALSTSHRSRV